MSLSDFSQAPWRYSHPCYQNSFFAISPAPEYASSEVLLSSLYRIIGMESTNEGTVPQSGRDLDRLIQKLREKRQTPPEGAVVDVEIWNSILHGVLESPKLPNQSSKRFLQVTPIVSGTAYFSGSARLSNNSWPAGNLIRKMICMGAKNKESAQKLWEDLFSCLSVDDDDDVFAQWLDQETKAWNGKEFDWKMVPIPDSEFITINNDDLEKIRFLPARQFNKDLKAIIDVKGSMTRRQWTSLLEAIIRLASVAHIMWLCDVNTRIWNVLWNVLTGGEQALNHNDLMREIFPDTPSYMTYGGKALQSYKDRVSSYLNARLGVNALLWSLQQIGAPYTGQILSSVDIKDLIAHTQENKIELIKADFQKTIADLQEQEARALLCKKGIGSNLMEFTRHVLGQRQAAATLLKGYDQGYYLKKKGNSSSSPWVVSLGPVAVLALVHCSLAGMGGPRSIYRLGQHFAAYGLIIDKYDIARNDLGHQLRMLGLILDSPDAESGMLLLPPFSLIK